MIAAERNTRRAGIVALALVLAACARKPVPEPIVATVDGRPVTQALFDQYVSATSGVAPGQVDAGLRGRLLEDLLRLEAAAALGERSGDPEALGRAELARLESLAHSAAAKQGVLAEPSETELQAAYRQYVAGLPASEFHAALILSATENGALTAVRQLAAGEAFESVASRASLDESKARGGDLGWIRPGHLPEALFTALAKLRPGEYTTTPIQTAYGWQVLKLIEARAATPPPLEQVKAQLAANLQQARYRAFLEAAAARVQVERK